MIPHLCSIHAWVESWNKHFLSSANFPLWGGQMFQLNTKLVVSNQALLWWQSVFSDQGKSVSNNSSFIYEIEYTLNLYQRYIEAGICHLLVKIKPPQSFHKWAQWSYFSSRLQLILIEDIFLTDKDSKNIFIRRQYTLNTHLKKSDSEHWKKYTPKLVSPPSVLIFLGIELQLILLSSFNKIQFSGRALVAFSWCIKWKLWVQNTAAPALISSQNYLQKAYLHYSTSLFRQPLPSRIMLGILIIYKVTIMSLRINVQEMISTLVPGSLAQVTAE